MLQSFQITPDYIIERAKDAFLSENFNLGFEILRDSFDDEEVSDETILDVLNGRIGIQVNGNDVQMSADIPVDEEYQDDINCVLLDYRTLYRHEKHGVLRIAGFIEIDFSNYFGAEGNNALKEIIERI